MSAAGIWMLFVFGVLHGEQQMQQIPEPDEQTCNRELDRLRSAPPTEDTYIIAASCVPPQRDT